MSLLRVDDPNLAAVQRRAFCHFASTTERSQQMPTPEVGAVSVIGTVFAYWTGTEWTLFVGTPGPPGPAGPTGPAGATGPAGPGIATGGAVGQVLAKTGTADYVTGWTTPVVGTTILNGAGPPGSSTGAVGDYYADTLNGILYGPKVAVPPPVDTFPTLATANTETGTSLGAANPIPSPSGVAAGDLLVANVSNDGGGTTITASTGWTEVVQVNENGASPHRLACFARIADGGANDALAVSGAADDYCASIVRITGHGAANIADVKQASTFSTTATVADPPNLDTGATRKWLWIAVAALDQNTGGQVLGSPVGYTSAHANLTAGTVGSGLGVAYRTAEAQTDNPPVWGTSAARPWAALTLAVPPGSGAAANPWPVTVRQIPAGGARYG